MQTGQGEIACGLMGRLQGGDASGRRGQVELRNGRTRTARSHPIHTSGHGLEGAIGHVMPAHSRVMPIGDVKGYVWSNKHVGRTVHRIIAGQWFRDGGAVTGAGGLDGISSNDARSGVAMDHLIAEYGWQ